MAPASVVPLRQRMGLVLLLPGGPARLGEWSRTAPLGHVEADFFGGDGYQTASLWHHGQQVWGPSHTRKFPGDRRPEWPINAVLARLGVVPGSGHHDHFAAVGLGAERDTEGWDERGRQARQHATYDAWQAAQDAARRAAAERAATARLRGTPVPLDGAEVMRILGIGPGRQVGAALRFLQHLAAERGELSREDAIIALRSWNTTGAG